MQQLWLIPILPLLGFAINGLFGRRFSKAAVNTVAGVRECGGACGRRRGRTEGHARRLPRARGLAAQTRAQFRNWLTASRGRRTFYGADSA